MGLFDKKPKPSFKIRESLMKNPDRVNNKTFIEEKLALMETSGKGQVSTSIGFPQGVIGKKGEEKPYDYSMYEMVYTSVPLINASIDLTIDFVVSPGLYVTSDDESVIEACNDLMKRFNFDILLRQIVKHMLIYGDCFVEIVTDDGDGGKISDLKILHPKTMKVVRSETGEVEKYIQEVGIGKKEIEFEPDDIAHFIYNKVGDRAYGTSMIEPMLNILKVKLQIERDMAFILERKANAPYHVKLGNENYPPADSDISGFASEMAVLKAKNEWVTSYLVDIGIVGTRGKVMDFKPYYTHYDNQIVYAGRVPYVLLGLGNIPEGLAKVQLEAFQRHVKSIQLAAQTPLEQKIFKKEASIVNEEETPKLQWGQQSLKEKLDEVQTYLSMLGSSLTEDTKTFIENKIRDLLGIEANITPEDREKMKQLNQQRQNQEGEDGTEKTPGSKPKGGFDKRDKKAKRPPAK